MTLLWILLAFLLGSLPFAVWLGRLAGVDPRTVGDGNPGTFNVWKLAGWQVGVPVLVLDFSKGVVPALLARQAWSWSGWALVAVIAAPVLGHAFSPFLRGRGGKGLATAFGVWTGLTLAEGPLILGAALTVGTLGLRLRDSWVVVLGLLALLADLLVRGWPWEAFAVWGITALLLAWGYRRNLYLPLRRENRPHA
jgi:acyl-phosphate glycerol 3-phosphate acyltransferase